MANRIRATFETLAGPGGAPALGQALARLSFSTGGPGFYPVTREINQWLRSVEAGSGLVTVFVRHTSASLTIQENADPAVLDDLADALERYAPQDRSYRHGSEGPDDMPAHIRSMLTATSLSIPVLQGAMDLGTWQDVYLIEHRTRSRGRNLTLHYLGT